MARVANRPKLVMVCYRGLPYTLDLVRCRRALVHRQVEGRFGSMASLAKAVGVSRSSASRFFSGRPTSLAITLKILAVLGLTFHEVAVPQPGSPDGDADESEGSSSIGAVERTRPEPRLPQPGTAVELEQAGDI